MADAGVPINQMAQLLQIKPSYLHELVRDGVIPPPVAKGRYALVPSVQGYITFLRDRAHASQGSGSNAYASQRARLTKAKADAAEMLARAKLGELVPAAEVRETWVALVSVMRTRMLAIPARVASRVMMAKNIVEIAALIRNEIYEALDALAKGQVETTATLAIEHTPDAGNGRGSNVRDAGAATGADDQPVG